ncbi:uncharacterized protein LOC105192159 [Harpegnathos saltator]|uniref:Rho GTPase-activating protein 19 n=1 Tax=Harpegnathos saltator TaxID=610380 RepID=E2B861_HARSA|nr:uncharacterized protein LOC105192159 [Harpegnathos saltator]EFN88118.1 Rho GTPase-activating protein 19 [Harpegnathos saltator]
MADFNDGVDGKLASRMRKVNPEQFHTLVKMHLSFELDIHTEDNDAITEKARLKKWGLHLSFSRKSKSLVSLEKGTEGVILSEDGINHVMQLINYLSMEQNIIQEGIFRRTGKLTRQQDLKIAMSQSLSLDLDDGRFSVHDCASVLKGFLAELSEPLLTDLHYPAHCQIAELCSLDAKTNDGRLLRSLQLLLLLLPCSNRILLKAILTLLNKTASYEHSNKMNSNTLATLFTPHLLCPRKLSPEALHINSQNLSCLVAFMIRKGIDLFEIPPKLATDIRAYWMDQERKLLSPKNTDLNESIPDTTSTAHTVFSFVDRKLTAKANSTQDTQAALAQLYAHIQAMPESAKKRRLVKQFNKENGQGTPRHVKHCKTKSLGDSIKKHIFHKRILGHKKFIDINIGCNIARSSSEENILSTKLEDSLLPARTLLSKSNDELSVENCDIKTNNDLLYDKNTSSNTSSHNNDTQNCKVKRKLCDQSVNEELTLKDEGSLKEIVEQSSKVDMSPDASPDLDGDRFSSLKAPVELSSSISLQEIDTMNVLNEQSCNIAHVATSDSSPIDSNKLTRQFSEPSDIYSAHHCDRSSITNDCELVQPKSEPTLPFVARPDSQTDNITLPLKTRMLNVETSNEIAPSVEPRTGNACHLSPIVRNRFRNVYAVHTSTPSSLLRRSLVTNDYILTPITNNDDRSMSPITQSATKMSKAMQESIMTPRSRKPVMIVSASNLCNLVTNNCDQQSNVSNSALRGSHFGATNYASILEESQTYSNSADHALCHVAKDARRVCDVGCNMLDTLEKHSCGNFSVTKCCTTTTQQSSMSITSTFREYLLSRSVLTASPVDLSFTSRTGDFEQSESDLNILNDEDTLSDSLLHCLDGNQPDTSDTSGIASGSTNSVNNSTEKMSEESSSPRKRGTSLQRNDSKRSAMENKDAKGHEHLKYRHPQNESASMNSVKMKDIFQQTSF